MSAFTENQDGKVSFESYYKEEVPSTQFILIN